MTLNNRFVNIGDRIETSVYLEKEDRNVKQVLEVINVTKGGIYAMNKGPFSKPHKDAKFIKYGEFKIYEP